MYKKICTKCNKPFDSLKANRTVCDECKVSRSSITMNYRNECYDRIELTLPKGKKDDLKKLLSDLGLNMSLNQMFNNAIDLYCEKLYNDSCKENSDE